MTAGAAFRGPSYKARKTVNRLARALCFLPPLLLLATASHAGPPVGAPPGPETVGSWRVAASIDQSGLFDGCVADRQVRDLQYGFRRSDKGLALHLLSRRWSLVENATYPVQLVASGSRDEEVLGRVVRSDRIELPLGDPQHATDLVTAARPVLEVRAAGATLRLPIDDVTPMLAALDTCWSRGRKAAENPFAAVSTGYSTQAEAPAEAGLTEEPTFFDAEIDGEIFRLEGIVVKPQGAKGRLPIALITHGTTTDAAELPTMRATTMLPQARDLAHRGYLAVAIARRGYGLSQGPARTTVTSCARPGFLKGFDSDAAELEAVLRLVESRPDADPSTAVAIGVSGGGGAVLALAARRPPGLVGVVNISGGLNLIREDGSHCDIAGDLNRAFAELGASVKIPSLWVYAQNDSFFPPELVHDLYRSYRTGGAAVDLEMLPPIGINGHDIFATAQGRYHWLPRLDGFLRQEQLPTWDETEVDEVLRAGNLGAEQRTWVARYLSAPTNKTLVAAKSGHGVRLRFGQSDELGARTAALIDCESTFDEPCTVLMQNFELRKPVPGPTTALLNRPPQ